MIATLRISFIKGIKSGGKVTTKVVKVTEVAIFLNDLPKF